MLSVMQTQQLVSITYGMRHPAPNLDSSKSVTTDRQGSSSRQAGVLVRHCIGQYLAVLTQALSHVLRSQHRHEHCVVLGYAGVE